MISGMRPVLHAVVAVILWSAAISGGVAAAPGAGHGHSSATAPTVDERAAGVGVVTSGDWHRNGPTPPRADTPTVALQSETTTSATTNGISGLLVGVAVLAIVLWRRWRS